MMRRGTIHCGDDAFTYSIDEKGGMRIHACVTMMCGLDVTPYNEQHLFKQILATPGVKYLRNSTVIPSHFPLTFWRYKRAVRIIESAVLNPNTVVGRCRLRNEFARMRDEFCPPINK